MSTAINVYAVPVENLKQLLGSGALKAAATICRLQAQALSAVDLNDSEISCSDAVAELITGKISNRGPGHIYGYAFEAICCSLGKPLPNICPISVGSTLIEDVDQMLTERGFPLQLSDLVFGGGPVEIPRPDEFPSIGSWSPEEIAKADSALGRIDAGGLDGDMAEMFALIRGWVKRAAGLRGHSLIGFHE